MAKPKFDYDSEEFYEEIRNLAMQGQKDSEIAYSLADKFGVDLTPGSFSEMKLGNYDAWSEEQNKERSSKITLSLEKGRQKINSLVRGRFLKTALGGVVVRGKRTTTRHMVVDGQQTEDVVVDTVVTEQETPPNISALATWLYHFDPEWKKMQLAKDESDLPFNPKKGVSIKKWIEREIEGDGD